jgi:hypothetical protein
MAEKVLAPPKNRVNPGTFGPGVIGESKAQRPTEAQLKADPSLGKLHREDVESGEFEKEAEWSDKSGQTFGPGVIGPPERQRPTDAQLRAQPDLAELHGLVRRGNTCVPKDGAPEPPTSEKVAELDKQLEPSTKTLIKPPTEAAIRRHKNLPVAKIEETLAQGEYLFDQILRAELKRVDGPRKAALRILLKFANTKAEAEPAVWQPAADEVQKALKPKDGTTGG